MPESGGRSKRQAVAFGHYLHLKYKNPPSESEGGFCLSYRVVEAAKISAVRLFVGIGELLFMPVVECLRCAVTAPSVTPEIAFGTAEDEDGHEGE